MKISHFFDYIGAEIKNSTLGVHLIRKLDLSFSGSSLIIVYKGLIRPYLDYGCMN